jgi:hypothetical protein
MGVAADIGRSLRHGPRAVVREHLAQGPNEARALAFLMIGCALVYLAQWPRLEREALANRSLPSGGPEFDQLAGTALFGWLMLLPLVFYFVAGVTHLLSRAMGGQGTPFGARLAMFWSWLAAAPLGLLTGALTGFTGGSLLSNLAGVLWIAVFAAFWWQAQREAARGPQAHGV